MRGREHRRSRVTFNLNAIHYALNSMLVSETLWTSARRKHHSWKRAQASPHLPRNAAPPFARMGKEWDKSQDFCCKIQLVETGDVTSATLDSSRILHSHQSWPGLPAHCQACLPSFRACLRASAHTPFLPRAWKESSCTSAVPDRCLEQRRDKSNSISSFFGNILPTADPVPLLLIIYLRPPGVLLWKARPVEIQRLNTINFKQLISKRAG